MKKLSRAERRTLERSVRKTHDVHERNRICVILAQDEGHSPQTIAKILQLSKEAVYKYLREYEQLEKTKNNGRGGSSCRLSSTELELLLEHLELLTYRKACEIRVFIKEAFGKDYSTKGVVALLRKNGFSYKKPMKVPTRLSLEKQAEFIGFYSDLKETLPDGAEIHFMDAVHPEYQSQAVHGWIKKGVRKTLQTTAKQLRLHIVGSLCLDGMKIVTREYATIGGTEVIDFCKALEEESSATVIYLVMDNARANKNKAFTEYIKGSKINPIYLPPYSPNLNPIERLWKVMREQTTYNTFYEAFDLFSEKIRNFFKNIGDQKDLLFQRINDNFQKIKLNPVHV